MNPAAPNSKNKIIPDAWILGTKYSGNGYYIRSATFWF